MVWGSEISKLKSVRGTSDGARVLNLRIQRKCGRKQVMGEGEKSQNPEKVWEGRGGSAKRKWLSIGSRRGGEVSGWELVDEMAEDWGAGEMWLWFVG